MYLSQNFEVVSKRLPKRTFEKKVEDWTAYIYEVHLTDGKNIMKYVGCQYKLGCHPSHLFTNYFTSSNLVKCLLSCGYWPSQIKILKEYKFLDYFQEYLLQNPLKNVTILTYAQDKLFVKSFHNLVALQESRILCEVNAKDSKEYLNMSNGILDYSQGGNYGQ